VVWKYIEYEDACGYTQPSLKNFINEIADRWMDKVRIFKYIYREYGIVGFGIIDFTKKEIVLCGNGFREDKCGEGGSGMVTMEQLLYILGFNVWIEIEIAKLKPDRDEVMKQIEPYLDDESEGVYPYKLNPRYSIWRR